MRTTSFISLRGSGPTFPPGGAGMAGGGRARTAARGAACGSDVTVAPATLSWRRSPPRADAFTGYHSDADAVSVGAWPRPLIEATITCSALRVRRSRESGGARCCSHVYRYELQRQELQAAAAGQGRLPAGSLRCGNATCRRAPLPLSAARAPARARQQRGPRCVLQGSAAPSRSASCSASATAASRAARAGSAPWPTCSAAWTGRWRPGGARCCGRALRVLGRSCAFLVQQRARPVVRPDAARGGLKGVRKHRGAGCAEGGCPGAAVPTATFLRLCVVAAALRALGFSTANSRE